jgi:hypothetical protein
MKHAKIVKYVIIVGSLKIPEIAKHAGIFTNARTVYFASTVGFVKIAVYAKNVRNASDV